MEVPKLTREFILDWLLQYAARENHFIRNYVLVNLFDEYLEAVYLEQQEKPKADLISIILEFTYSDKKKFTKQMLSELNNHCLAAIIMTLNSTSIGRDEALSEFVRGSEEDEKNLFNNIFLESIESLPLYELKEILKDIISNETDILLWETKNYNDTQLLSFLKEVDRVLLEREDSSENED